MATITILALICREPPCFGKDITIFFQLVLIDGNALYESDLRSSFYFIHEELIEMDPFAHEADGRIFGGIVLRFIWNIHADAAGRYKGNAPAVDLFSMLFQSFSLWRGSMR